MARKQSLECFQKRLSVIRSTGEGGLHRGGRPLGIGKAGGTQPAGMLSCLKLFYFIRYACVPQVCSSGNSTKFISHVSHRSMNRVPTRTGKPGKMGRHFPVREKSGNFEQTGKVRENHTKYWKTLGI